MSNYTPATDFAAKDALSTGNPAKLVKGVEVQAEFSAIQTAVNSKADSSTVSAKADATNPAFSGTFSGTFEIDCGTY
jgi:hypothetical protein